MEIDEKFIAYSNLYYEIRIEEIFTDTNWISFKVYIRDHDFSGSQCFCMNIDEISSFIEKVQKINMTLDGNFELQDNESEAYINFEVSNFRVYVKGQFGMINDTNMLIFQQHLDQTVLGNLYNIFKKLRSYIQYI